MKKLVFAALLCGGIAQLGTGCLIVSDDDDDVIVDPYPSTITASWELVSGDANTPTGCPEGATTMEVITMDGVGQIVDKFYCDDGIGVIERDPGTYTIWTRLTDDTSTYTYAQSFSTDVTVAAELNTDATFAFSVDRGSFAFTWGLTYDGFDSGCGDVVVGDVAITSTLVGDANTYYDDQAPCADYGMTVPGMVLGEYTVSISVLDEANDAALYVSDPLVRALEYGNHLYDLGYIELMLTSI